MPTGKNPGGGGTEFQSHLKNKIKNRKNKYQKRRGEHGRREKKKRKALPIDKKRPSQKKSMEGARGGRVYVEKRKGGGGGGQRGREKKDH